MSYKHRIKEYSYGFLEKYTDKNGISRRICGFELNFPLRYARYYEADYEPITFRFLARNCKEGGTFLDCGGHIGLFAVVGAKLVGENGKVFSFEATPHTAEILREVVKLNNCESIVEVRNEAVSDEAGTATFFDTGDDVSNANSLVKTGRHDSGLTINTISIDEFVSEIKLEVDVIKIDVEGSEYSVLQGALETLKNQRPAISLGLHPNAIKMNASLSDIWDVLAELGYTLFYDEEKVEKEWFVSQENLFDVQCYPTEMGSR